MSIARKHSRKRDAILECLRCTTSHPTAEWVYTHIFMIAFGFGRNVLSWRSR